MVTAAVCGAACAAMLVALAFNWANHAQPLFAAWVVLALAVVWSLFVRPSVSLDDDGVTIRNIVRDIHIPWQQLTDAESRWNLKVFAGDKGYTAWAITSQIERPKGASAGMAGSMMGGRFDKYAASKVPTAPAVRVTARSVARTIENAKDAYDEAVARGARPAAPETPVRVILVREAVATLVLPVIAVVILSLT